MKILYVILALIIGYFGGVIVTAISTRRNQKKIVEQFLKQNPEQAAEFYGSLMGVQNEQKKTD